MNFLHISDAHFLRDYARVEGAFRPVLTRMTPPLAQLDALIDRLPGAPEFVAFTGDLCEGGDADDYRALDAALRARFPNLPIYAVPGNHDRPEAWARARGARSRVTLERFGGVSLILMDSSAPGHPNGRIDAADCAALERALSAAKPPCLLLLHHHLIEEQFNLPPAQHPPRFRELIARSALTAILNGHTHHAYAGEFAGKPCYTAGSLSFRGDNRPGEVAFDECPSLNFCRWDGRALQVETIRAPGAPRALISLPLTIL